MYRIGSAALALVATLAIAACTVSTTPDDGETPAPGDTSVDVQLSEFAVEMPDSIAAGTVSFQITNVGEISRYPVRRSTRPRSDRPCSTVVAVLW